MEKIVCRLKSLHFQTLLDISGKKGKNEKRLAVEPIEKTTYTWKIEDSSIPRPYETIRLLHEHKVSNAFRGRHNRED